MVWRKDAMRIMMSLEWKEGKEKKKERKRERERGTSDGQKEKGTKVNEAKAARAKHRQHNKWADGQQFAPCGIDICQY